MVVVAVIPLLIVAGWYGKNAVLFQTYSTSSWLGMNVAKVTTSAAAPPVLYRLIHKGVLTPLAAHPSFEPLRTSAGAVRASCWHRSCRARPSDQDGRGSPISTTSTTSTSPTTTYGTISHISVPIPSGYAQSLSSSVRLFFYPADRYFLLLAECTTPGLLREHIRLCRRLATDAEQVHDSSKSLAGS